MKKWFGKRQRIYSFPNRYGFVAFALFLIMLATGATYQNNLIFAMAFLTISLALIAILQTARNVRDIEVLAVHVQSNFGGDSTTALLSLTNIANDSKFNLEVEAEYRGGIGKTTSIRVPFQVATLEKQSTNSFHATVSLPQLRGEYRLRRIRVSTTAPYGLFRAWIYLEAKSNFVVYPVAQGIRELPASRVSHGEDFSGHKAYAPGDSPNRIDWKVYSKRREHYIKEFRDGTHPQIDFSLASHDPTQIEKQLSQLSLWINEAYQKQYEFRLATPKMQMNYGRDKMHYHRCLAELALWSA